MEAALLRPRPHVSPVFGIHDASIERVLQKDRVQLLRGAIVDQLPVVPALEAQAVGVDAKGPLTWSGRCGKGERESGSEEIAASHQSEYCRRVVGGRWWKVGKVNSCDYDSVSLGS